MAYLGNETRKGKDVMGIVQVTQTENGFRLKQEPGFFRIFIAFLGGMLLFAGYHLLHMLTAEDGRDYIGIAFISLWLLVGLAVLVFCPLQKLSLRVELSAKGIFYSSWFRKKDILWSELKDYGISFDGRDKMGRNTYILYFSDEVLPLKNTKKKLRAVPVQLDMISEDYAGICNKVLPYCGRYTGLKPFLPAIGS